MAFKGRILGSGVILASAAIAVLGSLLFLSLRLTEWTWVYTLDDAYIHLAMARNLAEHGVWGVLPGTFTPCSSSPLWTILLATLFKMVGIRDWLPGVLNIGCVVATLLLVDHTLLKRGLAASVRVAFGLALLLLVPLTVIASTGMEHCLHVLLMVLFLQAAVAELDAHHREGWFGLVALCGWAFLSTAARFESLFVSVPVATILALRGRWRAGLLLLLAAVLPVIAHGLYSLTHGGMFLPNSLLLKGRFPSGSANQLVLQFFSMYLRVSLENVHVHILCLLLLASACCRKIPQGIRLMSLAVVAAGICQVTLGECGRFYRYEAYILTMGFVLLAVAWLPACGGVMSTRGATLCRHDGWLLGARAGLLCFLLLPLALRGLWANSRIVQASANIYQQQWQLARIFRSFDRDGACVAVNDLGLMAYRSGARLVDLWGLGSMEIVRLKRANRYDQQAVTAILAKHQVEYFAVFDAWFAIRKQLPDNLILVAKLRNTRNIVCLQDTVMIYACSLPKAEKLRAHLRQLPFNLPAGTRLELAD